MNYELTLLPEVLWDKTFFVPLLRRMEESGMINDYKMDRDKDPMGAAIADYHRHGVAGRLRVFAPDFDEDEIPVDTLFRTLDEMPVLEQKALGLAQGRILDVGAGAGCHTLVLQQRGHRVTAIDISPLSVATMTERGVADARAVDFWDMEGTFDTILMLMNGIGIVGTLDALPRFFAHTRQLLGPGGRLLLDSTDIAYLYEDEDGRIELPQDGYYGEMTYRMQYKRIKGDSFHWLYVDPITLAAQAQECGFRMEILASDEDGSYLASLQCI